MDEPQLSHLYSGSVGRLNPVKEVVSDMPSIVLGTK